jgi:hypothetical protein
MDLHDFVDVSLAIQVTPCIAFFDVMDLQDLRNRLTQLVVRLFARNSVKGSQEDDRFSGFKRLSRMRQRLADRDFIRWSA